MNKDKFISMMPTVLINEEDVTKTITEQSDIAKAGKAFASRLSINRYLNVKLTDLDIEDKLNLFAKLNKTNFDIVENELYFYGADIDSLTYLVEESFDVENLYQLDNYFLEQLLTGNDITEKIVNIEGNDEEEDNQSFGELLQRFIFRSHGMPTGDSPTLRMLLVVKNALIGSYLAEKNIDSLLEGKREIHDISVLM